MSDFDTNQQNSKESQEFRAMLDESLTTLKNGAIVKGTVLRVTSSEVIVDLGYKSDGIIQKSEYTDDPAAILTDVAKPGDVVEVFVVRVNDGEGNVVVSKRKVDSQANLKLLEQAYNDKTALPGKVMEQVKGGMIVNVLGNRVFVPASQISLRFEQNLDVFKGKVYNFNILEFDKAKKRILAGRKELAAKEADEKRKEIFGNIEIGKVVDGTISRLTDFGAFVDLGCGVDGLVHVSEISWKRVRKPADVLSVGDKVKATVAGFDAEKGKISLSLKDVADNPWNNIQEKYPIGEIFYGTVARLTQFGAFVTLEEGVDGLIHISQIANRRIEKPGDELSNGESVQVKVMSIDLENKRIGLSKREADLFLNPPAEKPAKEEVAVQEEAVQEEIVLEETAEAVSEE